MSKEKERGGREISRRRFLKSGVVGVGAVLVPGGFRRAVLAAEETAEKEEPRVIEKRTLGRTGLEVTVVGFGSYGFSNPGVLERAIESGINLILTDRTYGHGQAEKAIGEVIGKRKDRDRLVVGTGWSVSPKAKKAKLLESLDESLKRLQTDHVDLLRAFMVREPETIKIEEQFAAFEAAKKAGKARFYGLSAHDDNELEVFEAAADRGKFDFVMGRYNFMEHERGEAFIKKVAEKKIGFVGFKISAGKRHREIEKFRENGKGFHTAATKWALQNPQVTSILGSMTSFEAVEEYLAAVGKKLTPAEEAMLGEYRQTFDSEYCRNCGTCQKHCPYGVAVADVMRYCMYYKYYGTEAEAMEKYRELAAEARALRCADCEGLCVPYCPHGLRVRDNLIEANSLLS